MAFERWRSAHRDGVSDARDNETDYLEVQCSYALPTAGDVGVNSYTFGEDDPGPGILYPFDTSVCDHQHVTRITFDARAGFLS